MGFFFFFPCFWGRSLTGCGHILLLVNIGKSAVCPGALKRRSVITDSCPAQCRYQYKCKKLEVFIGVAEVQAWLCWWSWQWPLPAVRGPSQRTGGTRSLWCCQSSSPQSQTSCRDRSTWRVIITGHTQTHGEWVETEGQTHSWLFAMQSSFIFWILYWIVWAAMETN